MERLAAILRKRISGGVRLAEPMKNHTSFRIGGPADIFILPESIEDIQEVVKFVHEQSLPLFILGKGSNLLVKDEGLRGIVLKSSPGLTQLEVQGERIKAGAGLSLPFLAKIALERGLTGLEFISGIPGTVGGAVVMNAGAAAHSLDEVITKVTVIDLTGEIRDLYPSELGFDYRKSCLQESELIVLGAEFQLQKGKQEDIKQIMKDLMEKRKKTQPLFLPNAGSVFQNPKNGLGSAGKFIDLVGAKGKRVGDAQISELHANFIVNLGNARACDVLTLMGETIRMVKEKFGVELEPEIRIVGG